MSYRSGSGLRIGWWTNGRTTSRRRGRQSEGSGASRRSRARRRARICFITRPSRERSGSARETLGLRDRWRSGRCCGCERRGSGKADTCGAPIADRRRAPRSAARRDGRAQIGAICLARQPRTRRRQCSSHPVDWMGASPAAAAARIPAGCCCLSSKLSHLSAALTPCEGGSLFGRTADHLRKRSDRRRTSC
jgi:hypothetical protein